LTDETRSFHAEPIQAVSVLVQKLCPWKLMCSKKQTEPLAVACAVSAAAPSPAACSLPPHAASVVMRLSAASLVIFCCKSSSTTILPCSMSIDG